MKKLYILFPILFLAAFAFSSCQKEIAPVETNEQNLVTIVFNAEKVGDLSTKTAASEGSESVSYIWTDEDIANIKLFYVTEGENSAITLSEVENPVVTKVSDKRLNISAEVAPNATYTFRAILCNTYTNTGNPRIKAAQTPSGKNNYDPNADVLVSADTEVTVGAGADAITTGPLELSFARKVVINKMTLKNLGTTETVSRVVVRSTSENKHLLGSVSKTGEMNPLTIAGDEITLNYNHEPVQSNGEFPVYFISMAQTDVVLEVEVYTDQYIYSKTFGRGINLNLGQFTTFGVSLPQGIPATALLSGDYFITGSNGGNVYAAKAYNSSFPNNLRGLGISVNTTNQSITYDDGLEDCVFTFTRITEGAYSGYYTIQDANDLYLYAVSSSANQLMGESFTESLPNADKYYWNVTKNTDGTFAIAAKDKNLRNIMRFNYNNGNTIFSCYTGGQSPITLYPASWCDFEPGVATPTFNPTEGTYTTAQNVSISCATEGATIYYTTDGSDPTSSSTQYSTAIPISTTTTVKAIAMKDNVYSDIATATYTIGRTDKLDRAFTGVTGTYYTNWSGKTAPSGAVYAGQSAGGNNSIQLRSTNPSGIVTTTSGGYVAKITVTWDSNTQSGRTLNIYGKNTAYSSPADLYDDNAGILLGSIECGESTEYTFTCDCQYIGLRSDNGAMYLSEIQIEWSENGTGTPLPAPEITVATVAATSTATSAGTSATLNGTITLTNGAVIGSVTEAGFYYKLTSAANYTKVTCASVSSTSFSYDLTGLTKDSKYTFYAYAKYDNGSEVSGETATFTPTQTGGNNPVDVTFTAGTDTGETSVTKDGITVSMSTMSRDDNYRTYANSDMTVTAASGKTIKQVKVTCTGSGNNNYGPGKFSGDGYTYSGNVGTWSGSAATVTLSASAQVRMTKIVVTYN